MSDEVSETEYVYTYIIHQVFSVTATATPGFFSVDVDMTTPTGERDRSLFASGPTDPYGAGPDIRHWLQEHEGEYTILPYVPPPPPPYQLVMSEFWMRMQDDDEYDAVLAAINSGTPRANRQAFNVAQTLMSNSTLFLWAKPSIVNAVGQERADELMSQSTGENMSRPAQDETAALA